MADEFDFLTEDDYAGATAQQMLALAANERADFNSNLAFAESIQRQKNIAVESALRERTAQQAHQFKVMQSLFKRQKDLMKHDLDLRKQKTTETYLRQLGEQSEVAARKTRLELDRLEAAEEKMKTFESTKFNVVGSEVPMSVDEILAAKRLGMPIQFDPASKVKELVQDKKTGEVSAVMTDASVRNIEELRGADLKSLRPAPSTTIKLGPEERAEATGIGRLKANIRSRDYIRKIEKNLLDNDFEYAMNAFETDSPEAQAKNKAKVVKKVQTDIENAWRQQVEYVPGDGFYLLERTGTLLEEDGRPEYKLGKRIRKDIQMSKPSDVTITE